MQCKRPQQATPSLFPRHSGDGVAVQSRGQKQESNMTQVQEQPQLSLTVRRCKNGGYILHDATDTVDVLAATSTPAEAARVWLDRFQAVMGESPYEHVMPQQVLAPVQPPMVQQRPIYQQPQPMPRESLPRVVEDDIRNSASKLAEQIAEVQRPRPMGNGKAAAYAMMGAMLASQFFLRAFGA
jgi:hypothetical protein